MASKKMNRFRKKKRIRKNLRGTAGCPRLAVFRSTKHIYAQIIDDDAGRTLASACSKSKDLATPAEDETGKAQTAIRVGKLIADRCKNLGIIKVVFDRGGYKYHGRVAKLADGARDGGLKF